METLENLFNDEQESVRCGLSGESRDELISNWLRLDAQIRELADRRKGYAIALTEVAFGEQNGQKTVHLPASDGSQLKVEFGTSWEVVDKAEMPTLYNLLGQRFPEIFDVFYKPRVKAMKLFLNTVFPNEDMNTAKEVLRQTVKEVPKTPFISCEKRAEQKDGE